MSVAFIGLCDISIQFFLSSINKKQLSDYYFLFVFCVCVSMSQIMQHHGCRSHIRDQNKLTGVEERFDLVVDSNDVILERAVRPETLPGKPFLTFKTFSSNQPSSAVLTDRVSSLMKLMG